MRYLTMSFSQHHNSNILILKDIKFTYLGGGIPMRDHGARVAAPEA